MADGLRVEEIQISKGMLGGVIGLCIGGAVAFLPFYVLVQSPFSCIAPSCLLSLGKSDLTAQLRFSK